MSINFFRQPGQSPADLVALLDAASTRLTTPCGSGSMVWRRWGDEKGQPVVLVHGGGGCWSHWIRNLPVLIPHRTVYACDLPGLGESDMPEALNLDCISDTVNRGVGQLIGDRTFDLVGFSFGGPVSAYIAWKRGPQVRHYVMTGSRFVLDPEYEFPALTNWKKLEDPEARLAAHRSNLMAVMLAKPESADDLAMHLQMTNTPRARYYGPALGPGEKLHEYLPGARPSGKITGISGSLDQLSHRIMHRQEAALKSIHPQASFHAIPGMGHWVQFEAADDYNPLLLQALDIR